MIYHGRMMRSNVGAPISYWKKVKLYLRQDNILIIKHVEDISRSGSIQMVQEQLFKISMIIKTIELE